MGGLAVSKGYSIRVKICGRSFNMISDEKPEYLRNIAAKVNDSICTILAANPDMKFENAAVLSAVKFCDDSMKKSSSDDVQMPSEEDNLRQQVIRYANELSEVSAKCRRLEKLLSKKK